MKLFFIVSSLISVSSFANLGFAGGNVRSTTTLEGYIRVTCHNNDGGTDFGSFRCRGEILDPSETDYFVGPKLSKADEVVLVARHQDGSERTKTDSYLGSQGKSKHRFNLWILTLLQRPLLEMGKNQIHYTLLAKNKVIQSGDFDVVVKDGGHRVCRRNGYYNSYGPEDCRDGGRYCDMYFADNNYCQ